MAVSPGKAAGDIRHHGAERVTDPAAYGADVIEGRIEGDRRHPSQRRLVLGACEGCVRFDTDARSKQIFKK